MWLDPQVKVIICVVRHTSKGYNLRGACFRDLCGACFSDQYCASFSDQYCACFSDQHSLL